VVFTSVPSECDEGAASVAKAQFVAVGDPIAAFPCGTPNLVVPLGTSGDSPVAVGDTVRVVVEGSEGEVDGAVVALVESDDGSSQAVVAADGLAPGALATVEVVLEASPPNSWIVPSGSIRVDTAGSTTVEVARDGTHLTVAVNVGVESHGAVSVEGDFRAGDSVAVPTVSASS
jgi:hypothetical protein